VPGPTIPNRRFLIAGTANAWWIDRAIDLLVTPGGTVSDQLDRAGVTWPNYHAASALQGLVASVGRTLRTAARVVLTALGAWGMKLKSAKPEPASANVPVHQSTLSPWLGALLPPRQHSSAPTAAAGRPAAGLFDS